MRNDDNLARGSFLGSEEWQTNPESGEHDPAQHSRVSDGSEIVDGKLRVHSLSGHERNHLFLNLGSGAEFTDISGISGADDPADSRSFAILDYDRDGWPDIAMINAGDPLTRLYRNELGDQGREANVLALRLIGGAATAEPSEKSNRDGIGARITIRRGDVTLHRERRCGEGYSAQNSATMLVGIGDWPQADEITVRWPSGHKTKTGPVTAGSLVTLREDGDTLTEPYIRKSGRVNWLPPKHKRFPLRPDAAPDTQLIIWKVMAAWCPSCQSHLPELAGLAKSLAGAPVEFVGVPIDPSETAETLNAYVSDEKPAYRLFTTLPAADRERVSQFFAEEFRTEELPLPMSAVTTANGDVLWTGRGLPTVSDIRRLLAER